MVQDVVALMFAFVWAITDHLQSTTTAGISFCTYGGCE
jgi:hypothetical protein